MKYYDKTIYQTEQNIKTMFLILVVFIISFLVGFSIGNTESIYKDNLIKELKLEIDNLKNSINNNENMKG